VVADVREVEATCELRAAVLAAEGAPRPWSATRRCRCS